MAARTWVGGIGGNQASNPADWTPTGTPQPGDTLSVVPPTKTSTFTTVMNVTGNDLAGDRVSAGVPPFAGPRVNLTANVFHGGQMSITMLETDATFNLSESSTLNLSLASGFQVGTSSATVNITGNNSLILNDDAAPVSINLGIQSIWTGTMTVGQGPGPVFGKVTVNGAVNSAFNNAGQSLVASHQQAIINADVIGVGSFSLPLSGGTPSRLEFVKSVGAGQSVVDSGLVVLDRPDQFAGHITLTSAVSGLAEIDLIGLATADSYRFRHDILSIYSGNQVIERLKLHDATANGFVVEKAAGSLNIVQVGDAAVRPIGLPIHLS